jgi:transcriptional regulator with XRE-family HTH domain
MSLMSIEEIKNEIIQRGITAYQISKDTNLSEAGINKILSGKSNNPRKTTTQILIEYLKSEEKDGNSEKNSKVLKGFDDKDFNELKSKLSKLENRIDLLISSNNVLIKAVEKLNKKFD